MASEIIITADNTNAILEELKNKIQTALEECGLAAEGYAKRLCPVDTGNLRNSISHATDAEDAYIGTNVEYAPYVEMGTSKTRAQSFLKPAVVSHADEYKRIFENRIRS